MTLRLPAAAAVRRLFGAGLDVGLDAPRGALRRALPLLAKGAALLGLTLLTAGPAAAQPAGPAPGATTPAAITPADLFRWAEQALPQWFAGAAQESRPEPGVLRRSYPASGVTLWLRDGALSVAGGPFGAAPVPVGTVADYACDVRGPACVPPRLTGAPADRIRRVGEVVNWEVRAEGDSLRYQWWRDGQAVPGATGPVLRVPADASWAGAKVQVTVTNARGTVTSPPVSLVLRQAPDVGRAVALAVAQGCVACHALDTPGAGPPWRAIAAAYAARDDGAEAMALSVARGSAGTWSAVMPAFPQLTLQELALLSEAILSVAP
jgi:cytochrome c551/c552